MSEQINSDLSTYAQLVELRKELSAMTQRAEAAEAERIELHQLLSAETSAKFEYKRKLEAAEARIKESQEPFMWVTSSGLRIPDTNIQREIALANGWIACYAAPVIPPDVAELQRENAELRNAITRYMRDSKRLVLSNEELTKLLAEAKSNAVPEGWQLVPANPTAEMLEAGNGGFRSPDSRRHTVSSCYKAMLAAAPQPGGSNETHHIG